MASDPERSRHSNDPYFYARRTGPNLYNDREIVFDHVDPSTFIVPAYEAAGTTPDELPEKDQEVVLYATQLAIGTHRPQFVRDLEEAAFQAAVHRQQEEREQRLREKYGDRLGDTVKMGGLNWPIELADDFAEQMGRLTNLPIIDEETFEGEPPPEYRRPDGTHVMRVDEATMDTLQYMLDNHEPYHPHHGYRLSIEHEHLAAACAGDAQGIEIWDWSEKPGTYEERYNAYFTPEFFVDLALTQLMIDPARLDETSRHIAHQSVQGVLDQFGEETRKRHMAMTAEDPTESPGTVTELDLEEIQEETDRQTDFENLEPEDFA